MLKVEKERKYWLYAPGEKASKWDDFYKKGIMAISWGYLGDLRKYSDSKSITNKINEIEIDRKRSAKHNGNDCYNFANGIQVGDVIFVRKGHFAIIGFGIVESDYFYDEFNNDDFKHIRKVKWYSKESSHFKLSGYNKTLCEVTGKEILNSLKSIFYLVPQNNKKEIQQEYENWLIESDFGEKTASDYASNVMYTINNDLGFSINDVITSKIKIEEYVNRLEEHFIEKGNINPKKQAITHKNSLENFIGFLNSKNIWPIKSNNINCEIKPCVNFMKGYNKIIYGLPGCGKSYKIKKTLEDLKISELNIIRVTFHQDYSYSDFVGQIMPKISGVGDNKKLSYEFVSGPFVKAIEKALQEPDANVYLIIEEINRGNAPSIFGDTFQLLDRDENGKSEFQITNDQVLQYLKSPKKDKELNEWQIQLGEKIFIPANLIILATMNTSDQNVFTLDAAFKRRWDFEEVTNDYDANNKHPYGDLYVPGTNMKWVDFYEKINARIIEKSDNNYGFEDKRIGAFFVKKEMLSDKKKEEYNVDNETYDKMPDDEKTIFHKEKDEYLNKKKQFAYKMLEYLWNDVSKFDKEIVFGSGHEYRTLSDVIKDFLNEGKDALSVFEF